MNKIAKHLKGIFKYQTGRIIKNLLNPLGYTVCRLNSSLTGQGHGRMAVRDIFYDIKEKIKIDSPTIVDGGANCGDTIWKFLNVYPNAKIHAFEPIPACINELQKKFAHKNVVIHEMALGSENKKVRFNVMNNLVSSSIYNVSAIAREYHGEHVDVRSVIEVQQIRLDEEVEDPIDILKLDLQGAELDALIGSKKLIKKIKIVTLEVEFSQLYERQPLFSDVDIYMRENGFRVLNLYGLYTHPNAQLTSGDAIYLNTQYF